MIGNGYNCTLISKCLTMMCDDRFKGFGRTVENSNPCVGVGVTVNG